MRTISTKLVADKANHAAAVQIDCVDWLEIEKLLHQAGEPRKLTYLAEFRGVLKSLAEAPLRFQRRIRSQSN